ncbi:porin [Thalassospira tepidiphila]|uniref:porin n=1 Tax=Thalassospira tepidiphila TaxID=393657 RepID=UPI003AA8D54F
MKKILVASSALVAVGFAGAAQASEPISLSVGGYMEQYVGVVEKDSKLGRSQNKIQSDTEIHFKGATTLDNGIEIGAVVELEGEAGNNVDEEYLFINGGFGQVKLGSEDGAAADMAIQAPGAGGYGSNDGGLEDWSGIGPVDTNNFSGDARRVTYYTPVIGGFRAGLSYVDDITSETGDTGVKNDVGGAVWSGGAEFRNDFDGFSLAVSAVGEYTDPRAGNSLATTINLDNGKSYSVGANVGFGNFTVGGSYGASDEWFNYSVATRTTALATLTAGATTQQVITGSTDRKGFDFGVSYAMDAATVAINYASEDRDNYSVSNSTLTGAGTETEIDALTLGMNYTLGAGVVWQANVFWTEVDAAGTANDGDAYGAITGLKLSF